MPCVTRNDLSIPLMDTTSASLLKRLRDDNEPTSWERFVLLYTPLIWHWLRRLGVESQDLADFVQEVFVVLVKELPKFEYNPAKRFRGWLWTVTLNKWREKQRRMSPLPTSMEAGTVEEVEEEAPEPLDEEEYRRYVVRRAQQIMQADFEPATWQAFWKSVVEEQPVAAVAAELGIGIDAVYKYKSRVLHRLRQELQGLLD